MINGANMMNGAMMDSSTLMMCLAMILGILLVIVTSGVTIYFVVQKLMRRRKFEESPLSVLKERYAKGEITDEEFEHRRTVLSDFGD